MAGLGASRKARVGESDLMAGVRAFVSLRFDGKRREGNNNNRQSTPKCAWLAIVCLTCVRENSDTVRQEGLIAGKKKGKEAPA